MKKRCTNCEWFDEPSRICYNAASDNITELGDPEKLVCGYYEPKKQRKKEDGD